MKIRDLFESGRPTFSFEFFPPKTPEGTDALERAIRDLAELEPSFVSVTYGAGGSTRHSTLELVARIQRELGITAMAHLTCVESSLDEIGRIVDGFVARGVENVLALRGDPPAGQTTFVRPADGCGNAAELVAFIRRRHGQGLCLGSASYPEKHPESSSDTDDIGFLSDKVKAGLDFLVTQLFFDNRRYFAHVERARAAGVTCPIVPGIMPITNVAQIERFTKRCGASIPPALHAELDKRRDDPLAVAQLGVAHATAQCIDLLRGGAPGIHFFTLNQSAATRVILTALRTVGVA